MPKPIKFSYEKKEPFRDAFLFIIICEGIVREFQYFQFFVGLSSRVKIIPVTNKTGSAPKHLIETAFSLERELDIDPVKDQIWFVIDTDRWRSQILEIHQQCEKHPYWNVAQSNPCFEVWLYLHARSDQPDLENNSACNHWKAHLPKVINGGFNSDFHPIVLETAIANAKRSYKAGGYFPDPGSTQLWQLGEELLPLIKKDLERIKETGKFPAPNQ